jgi:DNA-binding CsgD family transcriptional regulator
MLAERARLVDVLAALSLTTDLATGFPFERGLRACLVADGLARALDPPDRRAAFLASLVRAVGCGHVSENAALFGDDIAFERFLVTLDPGDEAVAGAQLAAFETVVGAAAMTEDRPYRPAYTGDEAARMIQDEAVAGRLDPEMVAAVIEAAGVRPPRTAWPNDLPDREVDVLRLTARGLSNKEIASSLVVSPRTVQNHLAAVYDKTGRRTRAGAAVFAVEHGLI